MTNKSTAATAVVGDICLYGNRATGAGFLGVWYPHGQTFGTGAPVAGCSFTEAIWNGLDLLHDFGVVAGTVRIFDAGGERVAHVDVNSAVGYGDLTWQPAPVYTISADALIAASENGGVR